jgi:hypothetical protein
METDNRWRIGIETERTLIVLRRRATHGRCERCGQEVELVTIRSAEQVLGMSLAQMETQAPSKFHLTQAKEGLAICLKSLLRFLQSAVIEDTPGNQN